MTALPDLFSAPNIKGKRLASRLAAKDNANKAASQRLTVLKIVAAAPAGLTRWGISEHGIPYASVCARVCELLAQHAKYTWPPMLQESGRRTTKTGSKGAVLFCTPAGLDLLREVANG